MSWDFLIRSFISLFAITDPFGAIPIYLALTQQTGGPNRRMARIAAIATTVTLLSFALIGEGILSFFGISPAAFRISGGLLLLYMAFEMLHGSPSAVKTTPEDQEDAAEEHTMLAIVPIAIPMISGPGAISAVILLAREADGVGEKLSLWSVILIIGTLTFLILLLASRISRILGKTGIRVATRILGLIIAAIAVQFVADGVAELFPALIGGDLEAAPEGVQDLTAQPVPAPVL